MKRILLSLLVISVILLGACAVPTPTLAPTPTPTPVPSPTPSPTITPTPTPTPTPSPTPSPLSTAPVEASVIRVIDGDTIEVAIEGKLYKVRYIGIDTPEVGQPYADEATEKNRELVERKVVWLEKDVSETDKYNRLLCYVYVEHIYKADGSGSGISELLRRYGTSLEETRKLIGELSEALKKRAETQSEYIFVNAELVRLGYAQASPYPPDLKYQHYFLELEAEAREQGRGCWATGEAEVSPPAKTKYLYVGSINSNIYHYPDCIWAQKIKPENEIWFFTANDADAHGYRPCKVCDPPPPHSPWAEAEEVERFKEKFK